MAAAAGTSPASWARLVYGQFLSPKREKALCESLGLPSLTAWYVSGVLTPEFLVSLSGHVGMTVEDVETRLRAVSEA